MYKAGKIYGQLADNPVKTLLIINVLVRLIIAVLYWHITIYPDSEGYLYLAQRILNLNLCGYEGERSPGYPLLIAFCNLSPFFIVLFQLFIGIFIVLLIYKLSLLLGAERRTAFVVCLFLSCYIPSVFFEFAVLSETFTTLFVALSFIFFFKMLKQQKGLMSNVFILSILCSYLVIVKPFYVFLPFILYLFILIHFYRVSLLKYIPIVLLPLLVFLGWSYVNKVNTGYFVSTTFYGFNLSQNCVRFAEKTTPEYQKIGDLYARYRDNRISDKEMAMVIWEAYPELKEKTGLSFPDLSAMLYDYSIATIKKNPLDYIFQVFISWKDFWKTSMYWEKENCKIQAGGDFILFVSYIQRSLFQIIKILFLLFIPFNLVKCIRKKEISPSLIISVVVFIASILQALVTYGTNSRFSFPFEALMLVSVVLNWVEYKKLRINYHQ